MNIEQWPLTKIIPYARNPRKNESAVAAVKASIKEFGFRQPIVVDRDGVIVAGHTRYLAAQQLELKTVPVHVATELTPIQIKAYRLADNRTAQNATWDDELLGLELEELKADDFDLDLTGFSEDELARLIGEDQAISDVDAEPQIDRAEELRAQWGVESGQLWALGQHRLICGDCADKPTADQLINKDDVIFMLTDPPYGIGLSAGFGGFCGFGGSGKPIARRTYNDTWDSDRPSQELLQHLLSLCGRAVIFGGNFFADILPRSSHWIVWDKHNTMPSFGDCELAWTNINKKSVKKYTVVWNGLIGKEKDRFHPTQKPVDLIDKILRDYLSENEVVFDPFLGSGSTLIACERLGRKCRAIEISPAYVAVALQRFLDATGITPEKIG